jgi:hypothetical protein
VSIKFDTDNAWRTATNGQTVSVKPGPWLIRAEADGFDSDTKRFVLEPGAARTLDFALRPSAVTPTTDRVAAPPKPAATPFADPSVWKRDGAFFVLEKESLGWLAARSGTVRLTIVKSKGVFRSRRIDWVVDYRSERDKIAYSISGDKFRRQAVRPDRLSPVESPEKNFKDTNGEYRLVLEVTPARVVVRTEAGAVLDDYERSAPADLGRIGFKGPVSLSIR